MRLLFNNKRFARRSRTVSLHRFLKIKRCRLYHAKHGKTNGEAML